MKNNILKIYNNPYSPLYSTLYYLNQYKHIIFLLIFILLNTPSIFQFFSISNQTYDHQKNEITLKEENLHKQQQLKLLQEKFQLSHNESQNISDINQQIRSILSQNGARVENIQWNMEEKKIYLILSQRTQSIFQIIHLLNQVPTIKFQEMILTKLNREKHIQINVTLLLNQ
ncbi:MULTISPECIES: ATPase [Glaesserella]|uniref:ATPase n=1 Tax=Glaesserella australis TaxID=2094024 RepID=A0A328C1N0_9PAST|nr:MULTISPECIES: ATPase [Glaesserella]AUI66180.1 ATPase [Glaesserella sp. 15-184]RAL19202.1 ATPase [Glaesserella australis]